MFFMPTNIQHLVLSKLPHKLPPPTHTHTISNSSPFCWKFGGPPPPDIRDPRVFGYSILNQTPPPFILPRLIISHNLEPPPPLISDPTVYSVLESTKIRNYIHTEIWPFSCPNYSEFCKSIFLYIMNTPRNYYWFLTIFGEVKPLDRSFGALIIQNFAKVNVYV